MGTSEEAEGAASAGTGTGTGAGTIFLVAADLEAAVGRDGVAALLAAGFDVARGLPGVAVLLATLFKGAGRVEVDVAGFEAAAVVVRLLAVPLVRGLVGVRDVAAGLGFTS